MGVAHTAARILFRSLQLVSTGTSSSKSADIHAQLHKRLLSVSHGLHDAWDVCERQAHHALFVQKQAVNN
jgi:predicted subunit of tRNA(5-methylaminomethyl-2-thiouridylate) methyltransferase